MLENFKKKLTEFIGTEKNLTSTNDFYPCGFSDCKYYGRWSKVSLCGETLILPSKNGRKKQEPSIGNTDYHQAVLWCITCTNFRRINNYDNIS